MTKRATRYPKHPRSGSLHLSAKDFRIYARTQALATQHDSGGSYSMVATAVRSKPVGEGYNTLFSPAQLKSDIYPDICGLHAELSLWYKMGETLRGTTVTVAGVVTKSGSEMATTLPCVYCTALLYAAGVKSFVYMWDGALHKNRPEDLENFSLLVKE